jgi:hypothetical protein
MNVDLGIAAEDTVTGLRGTVTALCYYLGGTLLARLQWKGEDGALHTEWFERDRLQDPDSDELPDV